MIVLSSTHIFKSMLHMLHLELEVLKNRLHDPVLALTILFQILVVFCLTDVKSMDRCSISVRIH